MSFKSEDEIPIIINDEIEDETIIIESDCQDIPLQIKGDYDPKYTLDHKFDNLKYLGIFFAPTGGNVHHVAKMLKNKIGPEWVDMFYIGDIEANKVLEYKNLIFVCSTLGRNNWSQEQKDEWAKFMPDLNDIALNGRRVALVGLGDHITYPAHFVNDMGYLGNVVMGLGGKIVGETPTSDYEFTDSTAIVDHKFIGLPIDEDYEKDKTEERIDKWLKTVLHEFH